MRDLKIKDIADLLNVPELTIRRWISDGKIPSYRIDKHDYFCRSEMQNWVVSRLNKADGIFPFMRRKEMESLSVKTPSSKSGNKQFSLFRAIHNGDVLHHLKGRNKKEIIQSTMQIVAKKLEVDAELMTNLLLDRENLMPTALNQGIAVPHTRDFLLPHADAVIVVILDEPIDYGALDGKPVHTLFFLFACEDKRHLHLLAKIAHLSSQPQTLQFLQSQPNKNQLLSFIRDWEIQLSKESP